MRLAEIEESGGLRPGINTGISTTAYRGAEHFIHVSLTLQDALEWATGDRLLAGRAPEQSFVILEIRGQSLGWGLIATAPAKQEV